MGLSSLFGGGSQKIKIPPAPQLDPRGEEFQSELYPIIQRGLAGEGLTPGLNARSLRSILGTLKTGFTTAQGELTSQLNRLVPREDVRVREQAQTDLARSYAGRVHGVKGAFARIGEQEIPEAQAMAFDNLMSEKRIATDITSMFNQSGARRDAAPTYGSELAGGIGSGLGYALAGNTGFNPASLAASGMAGFAKLFNKGMSFFTR